MPAIEVNRLTIAYGTNRAVDRLSFTGRAQIVDYLSRTVGPSIITVHHCHHPEIEVDGDQAEGTWALDDTVIITEHRTVLRGAAFYQDRYRRQPDGWRILHTGYERLYEAVVSLEDLPGFQLTANRWTPAEPGSRSGH